MALMTFSFTIGCATHKPVAPWLYTHVSPPLHINNLQTIPVWVNGSFKAEQIKSIKAAINELTFVRRFSDHLMVVVGDRLGDRNIKTIIMHEFGHIFGCFDCYHINIKNSLMVPIYGKDQADCIDKISVAQVASYMGLDVNILNYCVTPNFSKL